MNITRTSIVSGKTNTMDLNVTQEQIDKFNRGVHVQTAFPNLSASEREFILSGITDQEWDEMFCQYSIFHAKNPSPLGEVPKEIDYVGTVIAKSPEEAFKKSQNFEKPWNPNNPCRSTSVGDIIETPDGRILLVKGVGFDELELGDE